jgi:hypothetical protein
VLVPLILGYGKYSKAIQKENHSRKSNVFAFNMLKYFAGYEELLSFNITTCHFLSQGLANFRFILVHKCTIKVPVASINSIFD